jgi:F-type H+-transporting ATPase subunit a
MRFGTLLLSALLLAAAPLAAQGNKSTYGPLGDHVIAGPAKNVDIITPHITDSHELELPFVGEVQLPRWAPVHIGGLTIDMSPTKHVIMLLVAALLCLLIMIPAALSNERQTAHKGHAKGFAGAIESLVLFIRNEVVLPNVGHHGDAYVPFAMTLFFFILFANLLGLIPYGSTATGNISVTATLAILSFIVIEVAGMKALGKGYWKTIIYWPSDQSLAIKLPMTFIMTPI